MPHMNRVSFISLETADWSSFIFRRSPVKYISIKVLQEAGFLRGHGSLSSLCSAALPSALGFAFVPGTAAFQLCSVCSSQGCGDACTARTPLVSNITETPNITTSRGCRFAAPLTSRGSERCSGAARRYCSAAEVGISSTFCYAYFYLISLIYCIIIYHMQISSNRLKVTFQLKDEIWKEVIRKNYFTSFWTLDLQGGSITFKI